MYPVVDIFICFKLISLFIDWNKKKIRLVSEVGLLFPITLADKLFQIFFSLFPDDQNHTRKDQGRPQPKGPTDLLTQKDPPKQRPHQRLKEKVQSARTGIHHLKAPVPKVKSASGGNNADI